MRDQLDVDLEDWDLLGEVELTISLMIAGTSSPGHPSREEIDDILGVTPATPDDSHLRAVTTPAQHSPT